jgi:hypothetical protein
MPASVRAFGSALLAAALAACGVAEVGDATCADDCDGDVYRDRDAFSVVVVGEPVYLCAAGVVDPRCGGARFPLAAEARSAAGDGGRAGEVVVEDVRVLAPVERQVRVHDVATAGARAAFDLKFRMDGAATWLSVTPDAHDWSEVRAEVTGAGPIYLTGAVSCRADGCVDAVGQGSYLGRTAPRPGALVEYQLALYPIDAAPGAGYDIAYTLE